MRSYFFSGFKPHIQGFNPHTYATEKEKRQWETLTNLEKEKSLDLVMDIKDQYIKNYSLQKPLQYYKVISFQLKLVN